MVAISIYLYERLFLGVYHHHCTAIKIKKNNWKKGQRWQKRWESAAPIISKIGGCLETKQPLQVYKIEFINGWLPPSIFTYIFVKTYFVDLNSNFLLFSRWSHNIS